MSGMTPERLEEARYFIGVEPGMIGVIARAVLRERDEFAAEVDRLRAQVAAVEARTEDLESERAAWISAAGESEAEVDRLRAQVDGLARAWDKGLAAGQESERIDPANWTASLVRNPYRAALASGDEVHA